MFNVYLVQELKLHESSQTVLETRLVKGGSIQNVVTTIFLIKQIDCFACNDAAFLTF